jgi:hypothetical protein
MHRPKPGRSLPTSACSHPAEALAGELDPPKLSILCRRCRSAWNQDTVPGDVIDALRELLDQGRFVPQKTKPVNHDGIL